MLVLPLSFTPLIKVLYQCSPLNDKLTFLVEAETFPQVSMFAYCPKIWPGESNKYFCKIGGKTNIFASSSPVFD